MAITFEIKGLNTLIKKTEKLASESRKRTQKALEDYIDDAANLAKTLAPADEGRLRNSISAKYGNLEVSLVAAANYAAYVEFGTRKYAAQYLAGLPADWKSYAATFKGGGGEGNALRDIMDWAKRKGIAKNDSEAYPIAISVLRNGVKPHPFMYPAVTNKALVDRLRNDLETVLK